VVQDLFMSETAQLADVMLPGASFAEKDGCFTNSERRVQMVRRALNPLGECRPDWEIVADLGQRLQAALRSVLPEAVARAVAEAPHGSWDYMNPAEIMDEIADLTPSYGGIRHHRLEKLGGLQWPCPDEKHPGTSILHVGKFTRGLGHFQPIEFLPPAELPDATYPLLLTTGRVLYHYHTGTLTRRTQGLAAMYPEGLVEMHPEDAARLEVANGDMVQVASRRGEVNVKADVTDKIQPGVVFMTFHFPDSAANFLTNPALDPVAKIPEFKACAVKVSKVPAEN